MELPDECDIRSRGVSWGENGGVRGCCCTCGERRSEALRREPVDVDDDDDAEDEPAPYTSAKLIFSGGLSKVLIISGYMSRA